MPPWKQVGQRCQRCDPDDPWVQASTVTQLIIFPIVAIICFEGALTTWTGAKTVDWFGFMLLSFPKKAFAGAIVRAIFFDWLQNVGIVSEFAVPYPKQAQDVLNAARRISSLGISGFSCLTSGLTYQQKLMFSSLSFPLLSLSFGAYLLLRLVVTKKAQMSARHFGRSTRKFLKFAYTLCVPGLAIAGLGHFNCVELEGSVFIRSDLSQSCEGSQYEWDSILASVALVQVFVVPVIIFTIILRRCGTLS
jgi:hypothetical protein